MPIYSQDQFGGVREFFHISQSETLAEFYKTEFLLWHYHKIPIDMFDDRVPFEKALFIQLLSNKVKEENEKTLLENQQNKMTRRRK